MIRSYDRCKREGLSWQAVLDYLAKPKSTVAGTELDKRSLELWAGYKDLLGE